MTYDILYATKWCCYEISGVGLCKNIMVMISLDVKETWNINDIERSRNYVYKLKTTHHTRYIQIVSDDKIQITLLILGRGALSKRTLLYSSALLTFSPRLLIKYLWTADSFKGFLWTSSLLPPIWIEIGSLHWQLIPCCQTAPKYMMPFRGVEHFPHESEVTTYLPVTWSETSLKSEPSSGILMVNLYVRQS